MPNYADSYTGYTDLGWLGVLPLKSGTKYPPPSGYTGNGKPDPTTDQMAAWAQGTNYRDGNLCLRLPDGVIGIDVDAYNGKTGAETITEAEKRWGPLPPTVRSTSRDDGVSGISLYRVPPGTEVPGGIKFPDKAIGDVDIIQHHHRYMVCWPSVHPEGRPYLWFDEETGDQVTLPPPPGELTELPQAWLEGLQAGPPRSEAERHGDAATTAQRADGPRYDVTEAMTAGVPSEKVATRLAKALHDLQQGTNRHDTMLGHVLALLRLGQAGQPGVELALRTLYYRFVESVADDRQHGEAEAGSEFARMIANADRLLADNPNAEVEPARNGNNHETPEGMPRLWRALDLRAAAPPRWLARGRLPQGAISLLVGDEGIGKSLLWVLIVSAVTTGRPLLEFGIPARDPRRVLLVCTEDDWTTTVRPRLEVVGADLSMVDIICAEDDGSGAPVFPRDHFLVAEADPAPALIVVDAWLDTVAAGLNVKDPQQARQALHPWKEVATASDAAVLLLTHTNRVASASARDRYGITGELRKKARMTLFAQADEDGRLVVGPEKMNTAAPIAASIFAIEGVQHFSPTADNDGTIPRLVYAGESDQTAREHLAASTVDGGDEPGGNPTQAFLLDYLVAQGGECNAADVIRAGRAAGFSEQEMKDARRRHRNPRIESRKSSFGTGWVWAISTGEGGTAREGGEGGGDNPMPPGLPPTPPSDPEVPPSTADGAEDPGPTQGESANNPSPLDRARAVSNNRPKGPTP